MATPIRVHLLIRIMAISRSEHRLSVDVETYSSFEIAETGVYRYVEAPDFAILLISYAIDGGPVKVLDLTTSGTLFPHQPDDDTEFRRYLFDPKTLKIAFNANFERTCLAKWYSRPMPPEEWHCTMVAAHAQGIPGSLATVGMLLGLPQDKRKDAIGKRLITYFCKPCKPTAANNHRTRNLPEHDMEKWKLFKEYNRQDVVAEMEIGKALAKLADKTMTPREWQLWDADQRINDRGVNLDMVMVDRVVAHDNARTAQLMAEASQITGLENPNSLAQLKDWLASRGVPMAQVTKETVNTALKGDLPDDVRRVLEIRQATGKSSVAKYTAMQNAVCKDGRLRGSLQFYGASRSGRWSGRLVQTQNLARNTLPDLDLARQLVREGSFDDVDTLYGEPAFVFSELVRTAFIPSDGCRFIVSDFSAIEARVIAWLAGQTNILNAFAAGKDIYCETASMMYGVPVVKHGINGELRARGKVAVLACGYGGGVGAMKRMDTKHVIPEEELQEAVDKWRLANPQIVKLWRIVERSAMAALRGQHPAPIVPKIHDPLRARENELAMRAPAGTYSEWFNLIDKSRGVQFYTSHRDASTDLCVRLPSGRSLVYADARLENASGKPEITYMGTEVKEGVGTVVHTWGGKLVENIVQAIARDCLGEVILAVEQLGYHIVMHIHDEIVVDVPKEDKDAPRKITDAMHFYEGHCPEWAKGLPLKGEEYECEFYQKD